MMRLEVLNEYKGKAGVNGQILKQALENFQPARGGPHANHGNLGAGRSAGLRSILAGGQSYARLAFRQSSP